jgi:hypothetical protein
MPRRRTGNLISELKMDLPEQVNAIAIGSSASQSTPWATANRFSLGGHDEIACLHPGVSHWPSVGKNVPAEV